MVSIRIMWMLIVLGIITSCARVNYKLHGAREDLNRLDCYLSGMQYAELANIPYDSLSIDSLERYIPDYHRMEECFMSLLRSKPTEKDKKQLLRIYNEFCHNHNQFIKRYPDINDRSDKSSYIYRSHAFYLAFEELLYFWNNEYYKLNSKKKIKTIIHDYMLLNTYLYESSLSDNAPCRFVGFEDREEQLARLRQRLNINSSYYGEQRYYYMPVNRFSLFNDIWAEMIIEQMEIYTEYPQYFNSDTCQYTKRFITSLQYLSVLQSKFLKEDLDVLAPTLYSLYERICGRGLPPMKYFAKHHSPVQNEKIYNLHVFGKCIGTYDRYPFKILLATSEERSQKQFEQLYRSDLSKISKMSLDAARKTIDAYDFFDNYLEGDTLVYNRLKQSKVEEELLSRFREKYLDNESRQLYKDIYGKYNKGH